jgi:hypothetical protein
MSEIEGFSTRDSMEESQYKGDQKFVKNASF